MLKPESGPNRFDNVCQQPVERAGTRGEPACLLFSGLDNISFLTYERTEKKLDMS